MKKPFTLNILLITRQLVLLSILFFGITYANASNNTNQVNKPSYDATNLQAAFSVMKMRIESERKNLKKISVSCNEIGTREQIEKKVHGLEKLYKEALRFSTSFEETLRKDKRDMLRLDIIRSQLVEIKKDSKNNANIVCKVSKENTPDITKIKKVAKETQIAAEKAQKLLFRMKEISSELYDSLSDTKALLKAEFKNSQQDIFGSKEKCFESSVSFRRQDLLGMIPEGHMEIKKRYEHAGKLLTKAKVEDYQHVDIYQARYDNYSSFVESDTPLHVKYLDCKDRYSYLETKCQKMNSSLDQVIKEKYRELLKLIFGIWNLREDQLTRLKSSAKSMGENVVMIYAYALDADECMGDIDLNKTTSVNTDEAPSISPELCTCSGGTIEVGSYRNESDCLKDQKIWQGDLVTWSQKNGGTCYRCPEEDVNCDKEVDSKDRTSDQSVYVSGTLWEVWGPIPYGYGTKCFTSEDISVRMKSETKKNKDGWFGRKGGGTMRPTGQSCKKLVDDQNTPGGSDSDSDKPQNINPIVDISTKKVEGLHKKARELWEQGKLKQAISQVSNAQKLAPNDKKIKKTLTTMQREKQAIDKRLKDVSEKVRQGKLKEAERILVGAAVNNDKYPEYTKARQALNDAKKKAEDEKQRNKQAEGLLKKAKDLWKRGALSEAIKIAQKASQIVPKDTKTTKILTAMQRQKKSMGSALSECDTFIGRGAFKKAESTLKKAERISTNYPPYEKMLDKLRKAKKKFDRIKKIIEEAKKQWSREKSQSAIGKLDKALIIDPVHQEAGRLKKEWEKILRDQEKASKPNWDNGCYNGKNIGGAILQWTLRDPPPYSGLTPICSDRDGKLWILNNKISQIIKGKQNSYGCYSGSTVKAKNRDYRGTLCRPKGYKDIPQRPNQPMQVNGMLWDWWGPIPYGYGKKCLTKAEVSQHIKYGAKPNKDGWYARKKGGTMKPTGQSCTKPGHSIKTTGKKTVIPNVVGMSKKQAEDVFKKRGVKTKVIFGNPASSPSESKTIEKTIPSAGTSVNHGETVTIVIHPPFVDRRIVPKLSGATKQEIIKKIKDAGLVPRIKTVKASSTAQSGKVSSVNPSSGTEVMAGTTVFVDVFDTFDEGSKSDPWVDKVISFTRPSGSSDQGYGADSALGPPTSAKFVAIDKPETIIFAFTDNVVVDGEGNDLKLHEYINGDSQVGVYVSTDNSRYIYLGKTAHSTEYDLANYNLSTVRYVKLVGLADGGQAKGYDLMAIEALSSSPDKIITFVDNVEDFGGKSTKAKAQCENYNKCLTEMMQEIQELSLNMASGQSSSFGCKYLGLGEAIAKVAQDSNSTGCTIAGNYAHSRDMIKATARQMCAGQSIPFDVNKFASCRNIGTKMRNDRKPTGSKVVLSDSVDDFNTGKYPLYGGVPYLNVPQKILGIPLSGTYFLSEWNVPKTFKGGHLIRPSLSNIDSQLLKDMGTHMVSFSYGVPDANGIDAFGMALGFFWLEPNDPVIQDKMQQYMKPLCNKRNMYIREVENSKGKVVRKDLTVYSSNTWSGILTSMPRQLFGKEDALIKTMTDLLEQLEPYVKQCN